MSLLLDVESIAEELSTIKKPNERLQVRMYRIGEDHDYVMVKGIWKMTGLDNPARGDTQQVGPIFMI